jgi:hypothetical protein
VALSTALARELLSAAASEESIFRWISGELGRLMSPMRRNRVQRAIRQVGSPAPAMTPSELFLLGRSFVQSGYRKVPPAPSTADGQDSGEPVTQEATFSMDSSTRREAVTRLEFPSLNRLQRLIPEADTEDAAAFRRETDQYGVSLQHRFGLSQLSIHFLDPYEQLDHNAPSDLLLDRICDLKIRLAEIQHSLGLPAYLGEVLGEAALRSILPKSAPLQANTWREVLEKIADVGPGEVQAWIEELLHQGILTVTSKDGRSH